MQAREWKRHLGIQKSKIKKVKTFQAGGFLLWEYLVQWEKPVFKKNPVFRRGQTLYSFLFGVNPNPIFAGYLRHGYDIFPGRTNG
jgi:hypothetical protein